MKTRHKDILWSCVVVGTAAVGMVQVQRQLSEILDLQNDVEEAEIFMLLDHDAEAKAYQEGRFSVIGRPVPYCSEELTACKETLDAAVVGCAFFDANRASADFAQCREDLSDAEGKNDSDDAALRQLMLELTICKRMKGAI